METLFLFKKVITLKDSYPAYHIDYSDFLLPNVPLPEGQDAAVQPTLAHTIQFAWAKQ